MVRAVVAGLGCLLAASSAQAAPGEKTLGLGLDYGTWRRDLDLPGTDDDRTVWAQGGRLVAEAERGFSDAFWWRAQLAVGAALGDDEVGPLASATVGVTYAFDVLKYIPVVHVGVGAALTGAGRLDLEVTPILAIDLGLVVLRSRTRAWTFVGGVEYGASGSWQLDLGLRYGWRWGTF